VITTPTVISLLDKKQNISFFLSLNEEDNNEIETIKNIKVYSGSYSNLFFNKSTTTVNIIFNSKEYTSLFPQIYTPPPEAVL